MLIALIYFPEAVAALSAAVGSDKNQAQRFLC
jgi:hypothetical protein